jgi:hypothetical protein
MPTKYKINILQLQNSVINAGMKCFETRQTGNIDKVNLAFHVPLNTTANFTHAKLT